MQVEELRRAVLCLGAISERHGAIDEARALKELARIFEAYSDESVASFVKQAKPKAPRPRARARRPNG